MNKKGNWSHIQKQKGHKSGLESRIDEQLQSQGIDGEYEQHEVSYTIPATHHTYKPDFKLPNGILQNQKDGFTEGEKTFNKRTKLDGFGFVLQSPNGKL